MSRIDFKVNYKDMDSAMRAAKMFNLRQNAFVSIIEGKYRVARQYQKDFASIAVSDFETFKTLPKINYKNVPAVAFFPMLWRSIKFRIFKFFTKSTKEEKQLVRMYKEYVKNLTKEEDKKRTLDINVPSLY